MRAFIFSLDAFVAFTLALVAIYSLIFFSSVPSAFYYLLTQGHYLSRDILLSLSTTTCTDTFGVCVADGSLLDNIVAHDDAALRRSLINNTVGKMVPDQFGYVVELSDDEGVSWDVAYDTGAEAGDPHAKTSRKLTVATQVLTFGYGGKLYKLQTSPYRYNSCNGDGLIGGGAAYGGTVTGGTGETVDLGIITCGTFTETVDDGSGTGTTTNETRNIGNTYPGDILGGDLIPSSEVRLIRLTIFI
ncbi:MAG: hypothetical protein AB1324_06065 [Candidatus Micrarchaeota archaeon]